MKSESPSYSAPALHKGLDILELLATHENGLSMKAIADQLGRSKSEIFRMLMVLLERGYIARDPQSDEFALTNRLFELGLRTPRIRDLLARAMPALQKLAEECGETPHLVVVHRGETVAVAAVPGGADMSFSLITERRRHAPPGAAGGQDGARGRNLLDDEALPAKAGGTLRAGQRLRLDTPGGGGHGVTGRSTS